MLNHTKFLNKEELENLKRTLYTHSKKYDYRNAVLIQTALETGGRASEILAIKNLDLNRANKSVLIYGLKGSRDREIPLSLELFNKIDRLGDIPFPIKYHTLYDIWEYFRPVKKKFHCLRHTFAIELYRRTNDIKLVQLALGHVNLDSTQIYMDYVYSQREMRKLMFKTSDNS
jgi:integrase/recombinase XerC